MMDVLPDSGGRFILTTGKRLFAGRPLQNRKKIIKVETQHHSLSNRVPCFFHCNTRDISRFHFAAE